MIGQVARRQGCNVINWAYDDKIATVYNVELMVACWFYCWIKDRV